MNDSFLEALARPENPVPGGGAAAAHTALVGLSLLEKIVRVEYRRHTGNQSGNTFWVDLSNRVENSARVLRGLRDEDGRCYMRLVDTKSAGKNESAISQAVEQAIDCPANIVKNAVEALDLVLPAAKQCKKHLLSDLLVVAELLDAAGRGACRIVQANLRLCADPVLKARYRKRLARLGHLGRDTFGQVEDTVRKRLDVR